VNLRPSGLLSKTQSQKEEGRKGERQGGINKSKSKM
jgi:hypothetical protein